MSHSALPGWKYLSWGYHSDNGRVFEEGDHLISDVNPTARTGDVIGCGVDIRSGTAFFTRNGRRLGEYENFPWRLILFATFSYIFMGIPADQAGYTDVGCNMISGQLFPVIGLSGRRTSVRANLGEIPFVYNE
jgi:hypothetical protein